MNFRTEIERITGLPELTHECSIMTLGSCFADEMGNILMSRLYHTLSNPVGTLFNPASIAVAVKDIVKFRQYSQQMLAPDNNNIWHSFNHHSRFSHANPQTVVDGINAAIANAHRFLQNSPLTLIITLGSARVFKLKQSGEVVANCHKFNADLFEIDDLDVAQIEDNLTHCIELINSINPHTEFLFTVSPVRHKAYGLHTDKLSKARLLIAIDNVVRNHERCTYFPAYEIMIDDLRDYRFYAEDMVHPSRLAVEYIYECFANACMTPQEQNLNRNLHKLYKRLKHHTDLDTSSVHKEILKQVEEYGKHNHKLVDAFNTLTHGLQ